MKASYRTYLGTEHVSTYIASKTEVQNFLADRFAGKPATSTC